jgi:cytochrome b subunit of formate dehydrogenase
MNRTRTSDITARIRAERVEMAYQDLAHSLFERQMENALQSVFDDKAARIMKSIRKMASKQGGESTLENYQLLGKRALITFGVVIITVEIATSVIGFIASRKSEEQRIERVVRRMLEEERQKEEAEAK